MASPAVRPDQIAVVTAAGAGIGRAVAHHLARTNVSVLHLLDRDAAGLAETSEQLKAWTGAVEIHVLDCTDGAAIKSVAAEILNQHTPGILVNGVGGGAREKSTPFLDSEESTWRFVNDLSVISAMHMSRQFGPAMVDQGYGRIVNISSDVARFPAVGMVDYTTYKSAVAGFSRALALEFAPKGVTVNAICPGAINTQAVASLPDAVIGPIRASIPMGRLGDPDEVASMIAFLCGPEAGYVTGQVISINGGRTMS